MRVCVTGGLGVIGSWITRTLVQKGISATVLDLREDYSLIPDCKNDISFHLCDIQDTERFEKILKREKVDRLIHAAAMIMLLSEKNPVAAVGINVGGTAAVMDAAGKQNMERVVHLSSGSIYDQWREEAHGDRILIDENFPIRPGNIYGITKWQGEEIARYFAGRYGFEFVAIRSSTMYGPGKLKHHGQLGIHSTLIENAYKGVPTEIQKGGDQEDDIIYAADIAEAVVAACTCQELPHDVYNIGSGKPLKLGDFAGAVKSVFPSSKIEIGGGKNYLGSGMKKNRVFEISRSRQELGFEPRYNPPLAVQNYREMLDLFKLHKQP